MANYTITAANVVPSATATLASYTSGASISAGQPVYLDTSDLDAAQRPKAKLADANDTLLTATVAGLAVNTASAGQIVNICTSDNAFTHGLSSAAAGDVVVLSSTAGALAPAADIASGWRPSVVLVVTSATQGILRITNGTAAKA
jgi:hypothetical protein